MRYHIQLSTVSKEKYPQLSSPTEHDISHTMVDSYWTDNLEVCKKIVYNILDVPVAEVSTKTVTEDFGPLRDGFTEEDAVRISNYYNSRLAIWNRFIDDLKVTPKIDATYDISGAYDFADESIQTSKHCIQITVED